MRTSLNDIKITEQYLTGEISETARIAFEQRMLKESNLSINVFLQRKIYSLVRHYYRRKLKREAEATFEKLFHEPSSSFRNKIVNIFEQPNL